ncbi:UPF0271 protein [Bacillus ectoiniformans]|uniref:LamB/YcsF family protein n=1 Tax=Bacillus ectoiniformans TaxID=1494429 RepID=UPI00195BE49D|nr:5-oxoprolinase subunit PxpA [Bacillus ectoiniformans]MBM7647348.1 UPF0271 protein [Bacillus ectoiniformans]
MKVDINCDMGEGFGSYVIGQDEEIMPYITSANIACGFHAGDPDVMKKTVKLAVQHGISIGAHPGLPDLAGFGRRPMKVSADEVYSMVLYQMGALYAFVKAEGGKISHVKPHGALYNMAAKSKELSNAIASAVQDFDDQLVLFGLSGSELIKAGKAKGLRVAEEVFADRTYQADGNLTSRRDPHALLTSNKEAVDQVVRMVKEGKVRAVTGEDVSIAADTICIHGDGAHALEFAQFIKNELEKNGIVIQAN